MWLILVSVHSILSVTDERSHAVCSLCSRDTVTDAEDRHTRHRIQTQNRFSTAEDSMPTAWWKHVFSTCFLWLHSDCTIYKPVAEYSPMLPPVDWNDCIRVGKKTRPSSNGPSSATFASKGHELKASANKLHVSRQILACLAWLLPLNITKTTRLAETNAMPDHASCRLLQIFNTAVEMKWSIWANDSFSGHLSMYVGQDHVYTAYCVPKNIVMIIVINDISNSIFRKLLLLIIQSYNESPESWALQLIRAISDHSDDWN